MSSKGCIAVTGSTGFVGRAFVAAATESGYSVIPLIRGIGPKQAIPFDLEDPTTLHPECLVGCAAIVHLAARIPARQNDPAEAELCWRANALGALRLAEIALCAGVPQFVHTVSANAYRNDIALADERTPMFPNSRATYYLTSKIAQELYVDFAARGCDMIVTALRLSSVYGAGQQEGLLPTMIGRLLAGRPVVLQNDGRFGADFVDVTDVAKSILLAVEQRLGGAFNVGSGVRTTVAEIAEHLLVATAASPHLVTRVGSSGDDDGFPALDIGRLRRFGYDPVPLAVGMRRMLALGSSVNR